jgi:hypothetical protein
MGYHRSTGNAQSGAAYLEYSCRKTFKDIIAIRPAWPAGNLTAGAYRRQRVTENL